MPRVLIGDPYPEIRELLAHIIVGMGLETAFPEELVEGDYPELDLLIIEPGYASGVDLARAVLRACPETRVLCLSIYPASADVADLEPLAYLQKPFSLAVLQRAILDAVERPRTDEQAILAS